MPLRLALLLAALALPAAAQDVAVTPLAAPTTAADGDPILLPQGPAQVTAALFEIAPGAALPVHRHPYPRLAYVLEGTLTVTATDTGEATTYRAGDVVVEMVEDWHFGQAGAEGSVRLLVIDLAPAGQGNTVLREE